ncbi:hypothetical protein SAMN04487991_0601 [Celeribacter neptunius]|uniref:Uncharacterized protein n=1 Tax=Celeribacter neptunius TaxID=588602 RepID=A0A1I3K7Q6_9RHOB|nr:hypothetical protein SAMN04487991_0601 [Celeribacter neptunius]
MIEITDFEIRVSWFVVDVDTTAFLEQSAATHPGGLDKRLRYCWPDVKRDVKSAQRSDPMNLIQFTLA